MPNPIPKCHYCDHPVFADWKELAMHISTSKKGHRAGKRWAARYIVGNRLKAKKEQVRIPLTAEQKATKEDLRRELSGATEFVDTLCLKGKHIVRQCLPLEYAHSKDAHRVQGYLVMMCATCEGK
jgi:hypothetical protein